MTLLRRLSATTDWAFPYKLASSWTVWYDKKEKKDFGNAMKQIYGFSSVKEFWGLVNHLNLERMPSGANLRIFKSEIQPVWEDPQNRDGGNWIIVPKPREMALTVFRELLLSIIGGDLDRCVNGIVLSVKTKDIILQLWLPTCREKVRKKVQDRADAILKQHCAQLTGNCKVQNVDWTWRAFPTASMLPPTDEARAAEKAKADMGMPGDSHKQGRGMCGECVGKYNCSIQ